MLFEGIVVAKVPYKERDLIVKLLLRNGLVGSFYVYGGQGGGKHHKPTLFEPGCMMKIMIKEQKTKSSEGNELMVAAEYQRLWDPKFIRHDIQAFYLMCLYFEVLMKLAQPYHPGASDFEHAETEGIFSVISNALFYLDDSLGKKAFIAHQQLHLFMVKLLFYMGIMPDTDHCGFCSTELVNVQSLSFVAANGNFACHACVPADDEKGFLMRIKKGYQTKFQQYTELTGTSFPESDKLIQYFCQQFGLKPLELRSYSLLFK